MKMILLPNIKHENDIMFKKKKKHEDIALL